ncbi:MAG: molybdate ABC transporter permease subunit [Rhizobiaceae bacterium]
MVFSLVPAFAVAWRLARGRFRGRSLVQALVTLPLVLPPVVTGYGLLFLFGKHGPIGGFLENTFGIVFAFRWTGAALAAAVMAFPLMVRPIQLSIEAADPGLEEAARTLGASRAMTFLTVLLPLALPGVIAGAILAFARAIGEFGATITFVANIPGETQTMSLAIYSLLQSPTGDAAALRLIVFSIGLAVAAIVASEWFARKLQRQRG